MTADFSKVVLNRGLRVLNRLLIAAGRVFHLSSRGAYQLADLASRGAQRFGVR